MSEAHDETILGRRTCGAREAISAEVRVAVFTRDRHKCRECSSSRNLRVDHIFPWAWGGSNDLHNLQTLCEKCNAKKSDRLLPGRGYEDIVRRESAYNRRNSAEGQYAFWAVVCFIEAGEFARPVVVTDGEHIYVDPRALRAEGHSPVELRTGALIISDRDFLIGGRHFYRVDMEFFFEKAEAYLLVSELAVFARNIVRLQRAHRIQPVPA